MVVVGRERPDWRNAIVHESSPAQRGVSPILLKECSGYVPTQFWPTVSPGDFQGGTRCENLENQTFGDEVFDIVITQDVMEHLFDPGAAYREIWRTLKPGGVYLHTTPIHAHITKSYPKATRSADGTINYIGDPEYHGNPVDSTGSLVTFHYGYDIDDLITSWSPFEVEIRRFRLKNYGIVAPMTEVIICRKDREAVF